MTEYQRKGSTLDPWTARCLDCPWTHEALGHRVARKWAAWHRREFKAPTDEASHHPIVRKGPERETR